jgi:hypothetical protein
MDQIRKEDEEEMRKKRMTNWCDKCNRSNKI